MPRYEYRCTACDLDLEVVQSFNDAALTECPDCSGRLRRVFSSVGVVFKGSGFYKTDSRSGGNGRARDKVKDKAGKDADAAGGQTVAAGASAGGDSSSTTTTSSTTASSAGSSTSSGGSGTAAA